MEVGTTSTTSEVYPSTIEANPIMGFLAIDNSSIQIAAEKLNGKNFWEWVQTVKLMIEEKITVYHLQLEIFVYFEHIDGLNS